MVRVGPSYPSTLGFVPNTKCTFQWLTSEGKRRIILLAQSRMRSLAPSFDVTLPDVSLTWNEEYEYALMKTNIPPNATLDKVPSEVFELAEHIALTLLTRIRMQERLDAMRERTAVAVAPRGMLECEKAELEHVLEPNSAYAGFQEAQRRLRSTIGNSVTIPPSRNLPGTLSNSIHDTGVAWISPHN